MPDVSNHQLLARIWLILGIVAAPLPAAWAQQPKLDTVHGRNVAERVCAGCHAIETGVQPRQADIPSFPEIANRPGRTIDFIVDAMYQPHPVMPGIPLTTQEMRDVAAYILTFRKSP